jgi:hypothetical protein
MERSAAKNPPYTGLCLGRIREIHDEVYFGRWRGPSPTDEDLRAAQQGLSEFIELPVAEAGNNPPPEQRDYLDKALTAFRDIQTRWGAELFQALNNTLSYGHRVLNFLLRARGEGNHVSRDFARYHVFGAEGDA